MAGRCDLVLLCAAALSVVACGVSSDRGGGTASRDERVLGEKAFVSGGSISLQLDGGNYEVRAGTGNQIRVAARGEGGAAADIGINGTVATVVVKDAPRHDFDAVIDVPAASDLTIRLNGGNLTIGAIAGSKDVENVAGNVEIHVGSVDDYRSVDATVKAGNIESGPFGEPKSGLFQHYTWSGTGKATLRASLGAGNLELRK